MVNVKDDSYIPNFLHILYFRFAGAKVVKNSEILC